MASEIESGSSKTQLRHPDPEAHELGCREAEVDRLYGDPGDTHVDVFCDCHRFTEPKILPNGSDVAWPAGWSVKQAEEWRLKNDVAIL